MDLSVSTIGIIELRNNKIISANYDEKSLTIHDKKFNLIKKIDKINNEEFTPIAIALNEEDDILYIAEYEKNRIIMCDLDFNKVKSIGSCGTKNEQFDGLIDICFKNKKLYVCDNGNNRIKIFDQNLKFINSFYCEAPQKIKVSCLSI